MFIEQDQTQFLCSGFQGGQVKYYPLLGMVIGFLSAIHIIDVIGKDSILEDKFETNYS